MHVDNQSNVLNRTYTYSATENDGRITQMTDAVSGETVQYQYDSLKRLVSAATVGEQWGQSFSYDGFGNMLSTVRTKGIATEFFLYPDPANNRLGGGHVYDDNGNLIQTPQSAMTMTYDVENRMVSATRSGNGTETYVYGPSNERVWKREEFTGGGAVNFVYFYGVDGALLTTGGIDDDWDYNVYFAGRTVWRERVSGNSQMPPGAVSPDRLGSNVKHFPYGDEPTMTVPNREKFATYYRDEVTALDYARNRYYSSTIARFTTADPYWGSVGLGAPQTWNRYTYVGGDPVNRNDPSGLDYWAPIFDPSDPRNVDSSSFNVTADALATAYISSNYLYNWQLWEHTLRDWFYLEWEQYYIGGASPAMGLSTRGLNCIKSYEGLSLTVYQDSAGHNTIGYGHLVLPNEDFSAGITEQQAANLLRNDSSNAIDAVRTLVTANLDQNQFDALVSFVFNLGRGNFANSTLLSNLNSGRPVTAANFTDWNMAGGVAIPGLTARRTDEFSLFSTGTSSRCPN